MRFFQLPVLSVMNDHLIDYPTPLNINYLWGFGSIAGICLVIQIITGIFLAMHYTPHIEYAFYSIEHIMRDVNNGWFIRYVHSNGASMFFIIIYLHIGRGLYFGSYMKPKCNLWISGVIIFILMIIVAFMGYVLPWGQMSFWGATVITNLFSAIPGIGESIAQWLWGGFSVDNPTLNRFFSLHYLLPFVIVGLSMIHLIILHLYGSSNPLGISKNINGIDKLSFYPYFYVKDLFGFLSFGLLFLYFVFFNPNILGHPDNYIEANSMVTPSHIVPEWYLLPFYAILRSIPDKLGGVITMAMALVVLLFLPFLNTSKLSSSRFRPLYRIFYWFLIIDVILLGWIGAQPVEAPYVFIGQIATFCYFIFFLFLMPLIGFIERKLLVRL